MNPLSKYCDTHAHLIFHQFDNDKEEVIKRAFDSGVSRIVCVGVDIESSKKCIELSETDARIWASAGIHPNEVEKTYEKDFDEIRRLAYHPKIVAIGETGLDYYREKTSREKQRKAFKRHIEIVRELELPLIIHIREAHEEALEIINEEKYYHGVMHAFSGNRDFLQEAIRKEFYIGLGGPITFENYEKKELIKEIPEENILTETDCPYLSPHPYRGKRNEPARVILVAKRIAKIKGKEEAEIVRTIAGNTARLFGFTNPAQRQSREKLSQTFLKNKGIVEKIALLVEENKIILEIGAGKGILTKALSQKAKRLIAVELDEEKAITLSEEKLPNTIVINKDILSIDIARVSRYYEEKISVFGNIPYSITSPILFWLLQNKEGFDKAIIMVQKEVAARLLAKPRTKEYGIPTVILGRSFHLKKKFDVSPGSFLPKPKVFSTVIELKTRGQEVLPGIEKAIFTRIVRNAFAHRRKKVITNLRAVSTEIDWEKELANIGKGTNTRAEELTIEDFCRLAEKLQ